MPVLPEFSPEVMGLRLGLHRDLLTLIRHTRSEQEIIELVIDAIWKRFPDHRVAYSEISSAGEIRSFYSRQPDSLINLDPIEKIIHHCSDYLAALRALQPLVVEDLRREPRLRSVAERLPEGGPLARFECPVSLGENQIGVLSLTFPGPKVLSSQDRETVAEIAELVQLIFVSARAQARLKTSDAIFSQFAENIDSIFWMNDPEHNEMIFVSPAYDRIWGTSRKLLKGNPRAFLDAIVPEDRDSVIRSFAEHFRGPYEKTYRIMRPDGSVRWIRDRSYPIKNEQGAVYRVVGIAEDITALKEAQEKLEATQAQVLSNAKFAALGEMASSIAHEINNPLAVIQGISVQLQEICRKQNGDALLLESLETVEKMSKRISLIIKGLRTFSRQTDWDPMVPADLSIILLETLAICEAKIHSDGITLQRTLPKDTIRVKCRSAEISQVLLNLLRNAIDAVEDVNQKEIAISLVSEEGGRIRISVEDSGAGVEAKLRDSIFQPFFTTKEVGRGTGLGLSISKAISEAHGGRLYLDAAAQRTRFVLELPAEN